MSLTAYLDTCVVSGLAKEDLKAADQSALDHILRAHKRGEVSLVTSRITADELASVPDEHRRRHETIYHLLADLPVAKAFRQDPSLALLGVGGGVRLQPELARLTTLLPDAADARHLYQAWKNGVTYFLTTDYRTILSRRDEIARVVDMRLVSPSEFAGVLTQA